MHITPLHRCKGPLSLVTPEVTVKVCNERIMMDAGTDAARSYLVLQHDEHSLLYSNLESRHDPWRRLLFDASQLSNKITHISQTISTIHHTRSSLTQHISNIEFPYTQYLLINLQNPLSSFYLLSRKATSLKPKHHFSSNPQTSYPDDEESLRNYRLDRYENGPNSVPFADIQTRNLRTIQASRQARVAADLNAILSQLS
ncbi:hypothetical protein K449DRAFT_429206 [Hypoxylon sp. EC38]|nr:hypothetical protein K449DRAFT_429206 [Hypoxylon sp. EC38]